MLNFLEIITAASSSLLIKIGTEEALAKRDQLWAFIRQTDPEVYNTLRRRTLGRLVNFRSAFGMSLVKLAYRLSQRIYGFN